MRLAFSSNAYLHYSFPEAARRIAKIGYRGIEIMADVPHAWPAFLLNEQKQAIMAALNDNGLAIANVNAFMMNAVNDARQRYWHPSWIEPDLHYRQVRIDHTRRALDLAAELGAPCITTEPGGPLAAGQSWDDGLAMFIAALAPVADHAHRVGVKLLVEPEPGLLIETADQYLRFDAAFKHQAIGLNFDIGHFFCVGDDPVNTVQRLGHLIEHVHLEDIADNRVHHHLVPGEGAIDLAETLQALQRVNYRGWVTIELYPYIENPDLAARTARARVLAWMPSLAE